MSYKKGLPPPNTDYTFSQIIVFGKPLDTILRLKEEHKKTEKQSKHKNKGEICNRMITDYIDFCTDCRLKPLFELPYTIYEFGSYHKVVLPSGLIMYVSNEKKLIKKLSMHIYLHGKAQALVKEAQKLLKENNEFFEVQRVVNYFLERLQAFIDQRELDYIAYYKEKYRI